MPDPDYSRPAFSAAIFCFSAARAQELRKLAEQCACKIVALGETADFLIIEISSNFDVAMEDWTAINCYLHNDETEILVWAPLDRVDAVFAKLPMERCHFFVDAADWQAAPILSGATRLVKTRRVYDSSRNGDMAELGALHRISDELADFARTLARIAQQDKAAGSTVNDKPVGFRHATPSTFKPMAKEWDRNTSFTPQNIRELIKMRRTRERMLGPELFADPGWDILLDLFAAQEEGQQVSVSSLCIAAAVPPTTALRWITNMTESGILVRRQDPQDARRVYIELSESMSDKLKNYFQAVAGRGIMPI